MTRVIVFGILAVALAVANAAGPVATSRGNVFTMCIPERYWQDCVQMMQDSAGKGIPISCISGRDRYDCIEKVGRKEADVVAVDPEDMYLAATNALEAQSRYSVVEQIRTKEEPAEPYRYEAVAVVHKDLNIKNVEGLRGLKSCHTGVGRNVGYKIPITKLTAMGLLNNINDPEYSARENELRALSSLFSKGCLVGTWSPDPAINRRLKETYSNMCALCENPEVCDYPDIYSGYEGALRCLAHHGGDVAWTKVIYVKRFFGLPVGTTPAVPTKEDPTNYRYFCPDGSKVPIDATTKPCTWAARPWQGYMTNDGVTNINAVQKELTDLGKLGEEEKAEWWKDLMLLDEKTLAVAATPENPKEHLVNAKYLDVIERNSGAPERNARWCVWSDEALSKCRALARAAHSRDARPRLECLQEKDEAACLKAVRDNGADVVVIDGSNVAKAIREYNVKPIIAETYKFGATKLSEKPALAVVKESSSVKFADLKGKKSCHSGYEGSFAGWTAPLYALKEAGLIKTRHEMTDFFNASCAPGAPKDSKLCKQCAGNSVSKDDAVIAATKCLPTEAEAYRGSKGALKCLIDGKGDVAFMDLSALQELDKAEKPEGGAKSSDFRIICPLGGKFRVDEWERCNLGLEPPRIIVTSSAKTVNAVEELTHGILAASSLYSKNPDLLQLFGSWGGQPNIIFKDEATGLVSVDNTWDHWNYWSTLKTEYAVA